jgi:hypothetical protein
MSEDVFPAYPTYRGLGWTVSKSPEFDTLIKTGPNQRETRLSQALNPIWHWVVTYNYLKDRADDVPVGFDYTDWRTLLGFILAHQGQFDDFLFNDPDDQYSGPAMLGGVPNLDAQLPLVQDYITSTWYSPMQRSYGDLFQEDISAPYGAVVVYANGVLQTEDIDYVVRGPGFSYETYGSDYNPITYYDGYYIEWALEPTEPITAEFSYYWRVRFESDRQDTDKFMNGLWAIGGPNAQKGNGNIMLITARRHVGEPTLGYFST